MKRFIIATCMAVAAFCSCSGNTDPEQEQEKLTLKADKTEVLANGEDHVTFTVMYGVEDVTLKASIKGNGIVTEGVFTPTEEGTYSFKATYDGTESESVEIVAVKPEESRFQKHVCVMEFTGTWCAQCPEGATTLNYLVNKAYKGKAFALAFHNADAYALAQEQELYRIFKWSGYPAYVTDMRDCGLLNEGGCGKTIEAALYDHPVHCGAAVNCTYNEATSEVTVNASVFSEKTMQYRLAVYVVEDKVTGEQTLSTGEIQKDYVHRHMVRKMLSADVRGDNLGNIAAGKEVEKTYTFKIEKDWNLDNLSVAILAIDADSEVNNMAICIANGGTMEYELI